MDYVELHCKTNFSFLEGASHADELIEQAANYGYRGLAVTDRNTLAGVVRGHTAARDWNKGAAGKLQYIVGCELHPIDGPPLVVWPTDRLAYGRLCRLLSMDGFDARKVPVALSGTISPSIPKVCWQAFCFDFPMRME